MGEKLVKVITKKDEASFSIEGRLNSTKEIDFGKIKLAVHAFIGGTEVANSAVNEKGAFKLTYKREGQPLPTELRVLPAKFSPRASNTIAISETFSPARYIQKKKGTSAYSAVYDIRVPQGYLTAFQKITKTYHMHGTVWATKFVNVGGVPTPIDVHALPAAKIEFYEVSMPFWFTTSEAYLGYCYSDPNGNYNFEFDFSYIKNLTIGPWWWLTDKIPDIKARISQFYNGAWIQIYEGPVDWDIVEDYERDYFIPLENIKPVPDEGVKPDEGFRFSSVGLLPIDTLRIVKGYATSQPLDPISVSHQPFCETLYIFGLFAGSPPIAKYRVEIADADENGPTGAFQDIKDPLANQKWNNAFHRWDGIVLGPDPTTGLYQNIDTEPEADWCLHALKATWNSANKPNGYYALKITGYDTNGTYVSEKTMPVIRIDNTAPDTEFTPLRTLNGDATECGVLLLSGLSGANRWVKFKVKAVDSEGHVLKYWISGTRGKAAVTAGQTITVERPNLNANWNGEEVEKDFIIDARPIELTGCPALAYNFELHVYGSPTNCYGGVPWSQQVKRETNLIISE